jgi:hypothetical protein
MDVPGFVPNFADEAYIGLLKKQLEGRVEYLDSLEGFKGGRDALPAEARAALTALTQKIR